MQSLPMRLLLLPTLAVALWHYDTAPAWADAPAPLHTLTGPQAAGIYHVAYSPDGQLLATSGKNSTLVLWDAAGKEKITIKPPEGEVYCAAFSPDGKRIATAGDDNRVRLWDVASGKEIWVGAEQGRSVYVVAFSPDGKTIASGCGDHQVVLWDAANGKVVHSLAGHSDRVLGLLFTLDGQRLISTSGTSGGGGESGGQMKLWDVKAGGELFEFDTGTGVITVALSPDGHRLAGACLDHSVRVWELGTGKPCLNLKGHEVEVYGVAFSPDGKRLASCGGAWNDGKVGEVKLWDLSTGKELCSPGTHKAPVWSVAFSPDGKRLALAAGRFREEGFGAAEVWDLTTLLPHKPSVMIEKTPEELKTLWADLAGADCVRAYKAVWTLRACPQSVAFLAANARTPPLADHMARLPKLIEDLDSDDFDQRQKATAELARLGALARPALVEAAAKGSLEVRLRALTLLDRKFEPPPVSEEEMRTMRSIEVLASAATPEARRVLEKLAAGPRGSFLAADAAAALKRLPR